MQNPLVASIKFTIPRWATLLVIATPLYFFAMYLASNTYQPTTEKETMTIAEEVLKRPFGKLLDSRFAAVAHDSRFAAFADIVGEDRSSIQLYEDGKLLGPAHSAHYHIAVLGMGRYAHWKKADSDGLALFVFSSSDNTDPNANGRVYSAKRSPRSGWAPLDHSPMVRQSAELGPHN